MMTGAFVSFALTSLLLPPLLRTLRRLDVLDLPTHRSSHETPTPRGGGFAPAAGATVALLATRPPSVELLLFVPIGFAVIGAIEDLKGLPPSSRLASQGAAAAIGAALLYPGTGHPLLPPILLTVACGLWIVAYANVFNFMDGIDGISGVQVLVATAAWWILGRHRDIAGLSEGSAVLAASALAFLPYNFPSARVFLGDTGSYFWGAGLSVLAVMGFSGGSRLEPLIAPLSLYIGDSGWTLLKRLKRREPLLQPHREHVYQRMVQQGLSHSACTGVVALIVSGCSILGLFADRSSGSARLIADAAIALLLIAYLNLPRLLSARASAR